MISILLIIVFCFSSCGYRFAVGTKLPGDIKKLGIKMFENRSRESGYEVVLTNALIQEFISRSADIYCEPEKAEGYIKGEITGIHITGVTHSRPDIATERKAVIMVDAGLFDFNGKVVRQLSKLSDEEVYKVSESRITTELNKQAALGKVADRMAETIYERFNDGY